MCVESLQQQPHGGRVTGYPESPGTQSDRRLAKLEQERKHSAGTLR